MKSTVQYSETYVYKIRALSNLLDTVFDRVLRRHADLTLSQFVVLMTISGRPGINQRQIAHYLGISPVAVKRQVDIGRGKEHLSAAPTARGSGLYLTRQGEATTTRGLAALERHVFHIFDAHNRSTNLMEHIDILLEGTRRTLDAK